VTIPAWPRTNHSSGFDLVLIVFSYFLNFFPLPRIQLKEVNLSYSIDKVFLDITNLHHGNDGLIYTSVSGPYVPGTDRNMSVFSFPSSYSADS
jgi:hypothetical protein